MAGEPAATLAVLETCVYCDPAEREAMERFYGELLGLRRVAGWADGTAFRAGAGVVLVFDREGVTAREDPIAAHGSRGPGHLCLVAPPGEYESLAARLRADSVEITHEQKWSGSGRRSLYFPDPAGNLVEIADGDLWPG